MSDRCPKCGSQLRRFDTYEDAVGEEHPIYRTHQIDGFDCLRRQLDDAAIKHRAWTDAFGTTQLTHAVAKLEAAQDGERLARAEIERLRSIVDKLLQMVPPGDWQPYDVYGDCCGYGEPGQPAYVDDVDPNNTDDVHRHGRAVGRWQAADLFRAAAEAAAEGQR